MLTFVITCVQTARASDIVMDIRNLSFVVVLALAGLSTANGFLLNTPLSNYTCRFEHHLCGLTTASSGLQWTVEAAHTNHVDHTFKNVNQGHYMTVQTSFNNIHGDQATFSRVYDNTHGYTAISFWYNFNGNQGTSMKLNVYIKGGNGTNTVPVFVENVDIPTHWKPVCLITVAKHPLNVTFEATVAHSHIPGKIAIDDINIHHGRTCNLLGDHSATTSQPHVHVTSQPHVTTHAPHTTIHGAWTNWGSWGSCSTTCGSGQITRSRTCIGHSCIGSYVQTTNCNLAECYGAWTNWGSWGSCSTSCGSGQITRSRTCIGHSCSGSYVQATVCNLAECHGSWTTWGSWGTCSTTCGAGQVQRSRTCVGHSCIGSNIQTTICTTIECPGNWAQWGAWSPCTLSCGDGVHTRSRVCADQYCVGRSQDSAACTGNMCPVDGMWSPWQKYSDCSVTCGAGVMYSTRSCSNPAPQYGGQDCVGDSSRQAQCERPPCLD